MTGRLPPLAAVRAFEAAARLLSFTKAADELGMTQAAVSYQIKVLEERVGAPLFLRKTRQVELTDAGRRLSTSSSSALDVLRDAFAEAQEGASGTLAISTVLTFASNWLARHLASFQMAHPDIAVRLETSERMVDLDRDPFDIGIRTGKGPWPRTISHLLVPAAFTPLMAPALAEQVSKPADILKLNVLDPHDPWWQRWFGEEGVDASGLLSRPPTSLGAQAYEASAALAGQGVAILTRDFFDHDIEAGRLVQPFPRVCDDGHGYHLAYAEARRNVPKIRHFRDWVLAELGVQR
jgi:LysR family transcriptional regulator, glycine cleavage system transcriptional activator